MDWSPDADDAIGKVPFFVRKRVRARVEDYARKSGYKQVALVHVEAVKKRYLKRMGSEVKGYQVETCFGPSGCPKAIMPSQDLAARIQTILEQADIPAFLKSKGILELKFHHEFRVALADCPNACSQPQIKDIGIIAAQRPVLSDEVCTACRACVDTCREEAVILTGETPGPVIDQRRCLACGQCIPVCPTDTLTAGVTGYRIQLGGKLGRHPQLARELPGLYDADATLAIVRACLKLYKTKSTRGERFGALLNEQDFQRLVMQFQPHRQ